MFHLAFLNKIVLQFSQLRDLHASSNALFYSKAIQMNGWILFTFSLTGEGFSAEDHS